MIAYFILVHRYPSQFKRLFNAVYNSKNYYLIHIDKKANKSVHASVKLFLEDFTNASILKSQNVVWGGYSMVDIELKGIKKLLQLSKKWEFFVNLSGQDYPLKSQTDIRTYLKQNIGSSFLKITDQIQNRPNTLNRIYNFFVESSDGFIGKPIKRSYLPEVIPYIGGQWKILSRDCCEFITTSPKVAKFRKFYKNTLIADESFFQTVLMNTKYIGKIVNDDKRAIIWIPDMGSILRSKTFLANTTKELIASGEIKLRPKTFTVSDYPYLSKSTALFARKFDETTDTTIFGLLDDKLNGIKAAKIGKLSVDMLPSAEMYL